MHNRNIYSVQHVWIQDAASVMGCNISTYFSQASEPAESPDFLECP